MPTRPRVAADRFAVPVPGARLHVQVLGAGPPVLILQSGEGDADRSVDLATALSTRYTVITHDRRGLSRTVHDAAATISPAMHAEDVRRVLAAVTDEPVLIVGCSLGALIALHLVNRYPDSVALLVAHEPVAPGLLPVDDRMRHRRELAGVRDRYLQSGLSAAVAEMTRTLGIQLAGQESEPGLTRQPMSARRVANFDHFLRHELTAICADDLDLGGLDGAATRILPAIGGSTPDHLFDVQCARELGRLVGREPIALPGGHNGNLTHPRAWATSITNLAREQGIG